MKRFVKEYANYKLVNNPFLANSVCGNLYIQRISSAVRIYEKEFATTDEIMGMLVNAEHWAIEAAES